NGSSTTMRGRRGRRESRPARGDAAWRRGRSLRLPPRRAGALGAREGRLPLVVDADRVDPRAGCVSHRQVRPGRMEDPGELRSLAALDAKRDDVLDLEVHGIADPDRMLQAVLLHLDRGPLDAEVLA